ncbi:sugar ABC transporter permease [Occultella glacieicola]|uniref:Sugar ABC transporter permease n=1 Tax=Occultella glacieicola TaxID=2518684 RepID=A0ABY2E778_9MICO|nr:sugar ABC transporter permease [Occultella glacieicola]TDE97408.1 sugar ABC transporter permease [Occultella glacieicola]
MTVVENASTSGRAGQVPRGRAPSSRSGPRTKLIDGYKWWIPWLFVMPTVVCVLIFLVVPLFSGLFIAFTDWDVVSGLGGIRWIGLENFQELLQDDMFWSSTLRTLIYAGVGTPLTITVGLFLGLALNRPMPARGLIRAIFFLPSLVNVIAAGTVWLTLLNPTSGMVNQFLRWIGISDPPGWFTSQQWALPAIILMSVWISAGYVAILIIAALQDLPTELYESAKLDGAGTIRQFTTITLPGLVPILTFLLITSFIGRSQGFGLIQFMTGGGPGDSTTVLSYYMYEAGFHLYRFGYAAAIGIMSMMAVLALSIALFKLQRGRGLYT